MIELIPAYGREYKTIDDALVDWEGGKDFQIYNGPYCSIRDLDRMIRDFGKVVLLNGTDRHTLGHDVWGGLL